MGGGEIPDVDAEASVHAGALETEEDGEADWRGETGRGVEGRAVPEAHWGCGLLQSAQEGFCRRSSVLAGWWSAMGRV